MAQQQGDEISIEEISEKDAEAQLQETYADPRAAREFFDRYVSDRQKALDRFCEEVNGDEALADALARSPVALLHERRLLGPLDLVDFERLPNPFQILPWPFPCRWVCRFSCRLETQWVCVRIFGFRFCWPRLVVRCSWDCRIRCF